MIVNDWMLTSVPDNMETIQEEIVEYKVYKEKPYLNSAREPFGLTINGKTKEYLTAHETIKSLMKKGKTYLLEKGKIKILDVTISKAMHNAIIEVDVVGRTKGNVELKVHAPSRKKGATLEMRKVSSFEYDHVVLLKNIIKSLLDGFINGGTIPEVMKNFKTESLKLDSKVTSKPKLFECHYCKWETRFSSALKTHIKRMHSKEESFKCELCDHITKSKLMLDEHMKDLHKQNNKRHMEIISPSSSSPHKKLDGPKEILVDNSEPETEMMDIEIESGELVNNLLQQRIKELEANVLAMEEQKKRDEEAKDKLEQEE